jgi:hypothetical protein
MEQTVPAPNAAKETPSARQRFDKKILLAFAILALISILIPSASYFFVEDFSGFDVVSAIVGGLTFSFLVVGIPIYIHYKTRAAASRREKASLDGWWSCRHLLRRFLSSS